MKTLLMIVCVVALAGCQTKIAKEYYPPTKDYAIKGEDGNWRGPVRSESNMDGVVFSDHKSFTVSFLNGIGK